MFEPSSQLWHAIQPSRWPDNPPAGEIDAAVAVQYAVKNGFTDMEIVGYMAHGYPGPQLERCA
eukprot:6932065-Prymnesium_polylepis.1